MLQIQWIVLSSLVGAKGMVQRILQLVSHYKQNWTTYGRLSRYYRKRIPGRQDYIAHYSMNNTWGFFKSAVSKAVSFDEAQIRTITL